MKKTTIAIHQPNFLPWLGYFNKMKNADIFVLLDDVQYTKNSFINRNRILTNQGVNWITIPVQYSGKSKQLIKDVVLSNDKRSIVKMLKSIKQNYSKATGFTKNYDEFANILNTAIETNSLVNINENLIYWAKEKLNIKTKIIKSSDLNISSDVSATERIIAICKQLNGTVYLSGKGGFNYQDEQLFEDNNITLEPNNYKITEYKQLNVDFEPGLSCIDYIFNNL